MQMKTRFTLDCDLLLPKRVWSMLTAYRSRNPLSGQEEGAREFYCECHCERTREAIST
jgi:hypothetical protein